MKEEFDKRIKKVKLDLSNLNENLTRDRDKLSTLETNLYEMWIKDKESELRWLNKMKNN